jgi:hypothetical protein
MVEIEKGKQEMQNEVVKFVLLSRRWNLIAHLDHNYMNLKDNHATTTTNGNSGGKVWVAKSATYLVSSYQECTVIQPHAGFPLTILVLLSKQTLRFNRGYVEGQSRVNQGQSTLSLRSVEVWAYREWKVITNTCGTGQPIHGTFPCVE